MNNERFCYFFEILPVETGNQNKRIFRFEVRTSSNDIFGMTH